MTRDSVYYRMFSSSMEKAVCFLEYDRALCGGHNILHHLLVLKRLQVPLSVDLGSQHRPSHYPISWCILEFDRVLCGGHNILHHLLVLKYFRSLYQWTWAASTDPYITPYLDDFKFGHCRCNVTRFWGYWWRCWCDLCWSAGRIERVRWDMQGCWWRRDPLCRSFLHRNFLCMRLSLSHLLLSPLSPTVLLMLARVMFVKFIPFWQTSFMCTCCTYPHT